MGAARLRLSGWIEKSLFSKLNVTMSANKTPNGLAPGQVLGKYRLARKIAEGGSGTVWKARDQMEGIWVALKIPLQKLDGTVDEESIRKEIRLVASLRHPNILPIKNADLIDGRIVLATELCAGTLDDRSKPMMPHRIIAIMKQVLEALAYAHQQRVVHCDVTPGNIFLFPDGRAALGDFGISRYQRGRIVTMDEFGTPGYVAPEQAYGKPTFASDCFAAALILYEYITGYLPHWPFEWPLRGVDRLQNRTNWSFMRLIRKALELSPKDRFYNADEMMQVLSGVVPELLSGNGAKSRRKRATRGADWRRVRREAFLTRYEKVLNPEFGCVTCGEPICEIMSGCPWCGETRNRFEHDSVFPGYCPDCRKGVLPEWRYCPWCYGRPFAEFEQRRRADRRYKARCVACSGKLMPFMSYCPWCRHKTARPWRIHPFPDRCRRCRWSIDTSFWTHCPWCRGKC